MNDLISRQGTIDAIMQWESESYLTINNLIDKKVARAIIENLPSTQPEIICCKNCKHWIPYDWMFSEVWQSQNINDYPEDEIGCDCSDIAMKANDFCSRGEKREVTT